MATATLTAASEQPLTPLRLSLELSIDEAMYCRVTVTRADASVAFTEKLNLAAGEKKAFTDRMAPLNTDIPYLVKIESISGDESRVVFNEIIVVTPPRSAECCAYGMDAHGGYVLAKGLGNPSQSVTYTRPQRTLVHYQGRREPVLYDGTAEGMTVTFGVKAAGRESVDAWTAIANSGRPCLLKTWDGLVLWAVLDVQVATDFGQPLTWTVGVTATRVEE